MSAPKWTVVCEHSFDRHAVLEGIGHRCLVPGCGCQWPPPGESGSRVSPGPELGDNSVWLAPYENLFALMAQP